MRDLERFLCKSNRKQLKEEEEVRRSSKDVDTFFIR